MVVPGSTPAINRPAGDPDSGEYGRPAAVRWSPFNLTTNNQWNAGDVPVRGGVEVQYPTQAGALFQWVSTSNPRRAWAPWNTVTTGWVNATPPGNWGATNTTANQSANINLRDEHETCPVGWRRPTDGRIEGDNTALNTAASDILLSEMRQSLFLNPGVSNFSSNESNAVFGAYADGFFDRRGRMHPHGSNTGGNESAVSRDTADLAVRGTLFFNPHSGASLFLPATGHRNRHGGLSLVGLRGFIWSSTQGGDTLAAWSLQFDSSDTHVRGNQGTNSERLYGFSIRCVAE